MSGFLPEGAPLPEVDLALFRRGAMLPMFDGLVARVGGEVVGGAGSDSSHGITSLFGTSVLPAYRRRGIQQALIQARLLHGRGRGCPLATIQSRPGSATERNAARLGFHVAYTRLVLCRPAGAGSS